MIRSWLKVALWNFLIAAILGALMRYAFVAELPWMKFRFVQHGHSHVAMLGWLYLAFYACLIHAFLPLQKQQSPFYRYLFWFTQATVIGMMITFPIQGYAAWSITFSTLHVLGAYAFAYQFLRDIRQESSKKSLANTWVKSAFGLLIISTLGLWAMGPVMVFDPGKGSAYYLVIQFYLHFQFNGWFVFAALALLFKWLENNGLDTDSKDLRLFWGLLLISCFPTYALALTWANPLDVLFYVNSAGVLIQLAALFYFLRGIRGHYPAIRRLVAGNFTVLFGISFVCFCLKILFHAVIVIPAIATVAYTIRNFVIGFFHLILLGIITHFVLGYAVQTRLINLDSLGNRLGIWLFVAGFVGSESILFIQGTLFWIGWGFMPGYYVLLFTVSALMPLGILLLVLKKRTHVLQ